MSAPFTELAKKYSHPTGPDHKILAGTGKSGLTPLPPRSSTASKIEKKKREKLERYQRKRCHGFTVAQLVQMEAFAPLWKSWRDEGRAAVKRAQPMTEAQNVLKSVFPRSLAYKGEVVMPLHPLYSRKYWRNRLPKGQARFMLPGGKHGNWGAHNDYVWEVLKPCIRLASQYLNNAHTFPWWESFLTPSAWGYVDPDRIPLAWRIRMQQNPSLSLQLDWINTSNFKYHYSRNRSNHLHLSIKDHIGKIQFDIMSCTLEPKTGMPRRGGNPYGEASIDEVTQKSMVFIPFELLEALFREDLNAAERNVEVFRVANTLLHETAHAIFASMQVKFDLNLSQPEPYVNDQPLSELGYSMEDSVFGGSVRYLIDDFPPWFSFSRGLPCATVYRQKWFNKSNAEYQGHHAGPILTPLPEDWEYQDLYPVPVGFFEDLHHAEFWLHCRRYGGKSMWMGPLTWGVRSQILDGQKGCRWFDDENAEVMVFHELENQERDITFETETQRHVVSAMENLDNRRKQRRNRIIQNLFNSGRTFMDALKTKVADPISPEYLYPYTAREPDEGEKSDDNDNTWYTLVPIVFSCPRYLEIRSYLLENRSQGQLYLDTLPSWSKDRRGRGYCEHVLLDQILRFGGLQITPEEFHQYLRIASERGEMFVWQPETRGQVFWIEPLDPMFPYKATPLGTSPLKNISARWAMRFLRLCAHSNILGAYPMDWDIERLTFLLNYTYSMRWPGTEFGFLDCDNLQHLIALVDWFDRDGLFWCWGPNGAVRRRDGVEWRGVEKLEEDDRIILLNPYWDGIR